MPLLDLSDVGDGKEEGTGMLRGVLSCFAGVGGVAIVLWLVIYVFLEPYDPSEYNSSPTQVFTDTLVKCPLKA